MKSLRWFSVILLLLLLPPGCKIEKRRASHPGINPLESQLKYPAMVNRRDGIAAAILLDTSGSMHDRLVDADGQSKPKLAIALVALESVIRQFEDFARKNPDRQVVVGIYEFSTRDEEPRCREVVRLGPPSLEAAQAALKKVKANGGTPIGDAMIQAKRDLDVTGYTRRHMLVITDGENNRGYAPGDVANVISRQPDEERTSLYFVAFDTNAEPFRAVRDAGGLLLSASSERDLNQTLDFVLTGKILAEAPVSPSR